MARHTRPTRNSDAPLPRKGNVIFEGHRYHIASVRDLGEGRFSYTLYPFDPARQRTLHNITAQQIIQELDRFSRYKIGQKVNLAHSTQMEVIKRQWDFRKGTVWYYVADPRRNVGTGWLTQETMMKHDREMDPIIGSRME